MGRRTVADKLNNAGFTRAGRVTKKEAEAGASSKHGIAKLKRRFNNKAKGLTIEARVTEAKKTRTGNTYNEWVLFSTKNRKKVIDSDRSLVDLLLRVIEKNG